MTSTMRFDQWQNSQGLGSVELDSSGNLKTPGINWILFSTPVTSEFSFTGTVNTSWTLNSS